MLNIFLDEAKTSTPYLSAVEQARLQSTKSSSRSREADDELDSDDAGTEDDEELKALNQQGDHRL